MSSRPRDEDFTDIKVIHPRDLQSDVKSEAEKERTRKAWSHPGLSPSLTNPKPSLESRVDLIEKTLRTLLDRFESLDGVKSK